MLLARAIFTSDTPLAIVENECWKKLFKTVRPSYELPSRKYVSTKLLNKEFQCQKTYIESIIAQAQSLNLQCDGWSNIRQEGNL